MLRGERKRRQNDDIVVCQKRGVQVRQLRHLEFLDSFCAQNLCDKILVRIGGVCVRDHEDWLRGCGRRLPHTRETEQENAAAGEQ